MYLVHFSRKSRRLHALSSFAGTHGIWVLACPYTKKYTLKEEPVVYGLDNDQEIKEATISVIGSRNEPIGVRMVRSRSARAL
jgi:hypothetical protein